MSERLSVSTRRPVPDDMFGGRLNPLSPPVSTPKRAGTQA